MVLEHAGEHGLLCSGHSKPRAQQTMFSSHGVQVTPRLSVLASLGQGLRICTSNKLSGSAAAASQGTVL